VFFGRPVLENYLIRRAESPIWTILMDGALALIGYRAVKRLTHKVQAGAAYAQKGMAWWKTRHRLLRWTVGSCLIFGAGFFGFGLIILPMWIPITGRVMQSVHFFWVDRIINTWVGPAQRRYRRLMRTNPVLRVMRRPYRFLVYWLLLTVRKTARALRVFVARLWAFEQRVVHH
jgi:hypothetical protein